MTDSDRKYRVVITITEFMPVSRLWREARQLIEGAPTELLALFLSDDQWHRAASLPFTREISRLGGRHADFTAQRASEVHRDAIDRTRKELQLLAAEEDKAPEVEVLPESELEQIVDRIAGSHSIIVVPSFLVQQPLFQRLRELGCEIIVIDD